MVGINFVDKKDNNKERLVEDEYADGKGFVEKMKNEGVLFDS